MPSDASSDEGLDSVSAGHRFCSLPTAGPHDLHSFPTRRSSDLSYSLQVQRLTASQRCGTAITCDVAATNTISANADTDLHQFSGVAGELVHITKIGGAHV